MLRQGRFDCYIPVGGLDKEGSKSTLQNYLSKLKAGEIALDRGCEMMSGFTPAILNTLMEEFEKDSVTN